MRSCPGVSKGSRWLIANKLGLHKETQQEAAVRMHQHRAKLRAAAAQERAHLLDPVSGQPLFRPVRRHGGHFLLMLWRVVRRYRVADFDKSHLPRLPVLPPPLVADWSCGRLAVPLNVCACVTALSACL